MIAQGTDGGTSKHLVKSRTRQGDVKHEYPNVAGHSKRRRQTGHTDHSGTSENRPKYRIAQRINGWHRATSLEIQKGHLTPNRIKATACARAPWLRGRRNHPVRHQPGRTGPGKEHHHQHGHLDQRAHHMHGANAKVSAPTLNKDRKRLHRAAREVAAVASTLRRRLSTSSAALLASAA